MNIVRCHFRAAQTRQIESARAFGSTGRRVSKRACVTELQPELGAVFAALPGKFPETVKVGSLVEYQIARLLRETGIALHLADYGYGHPTFGPTLIQPDLFNCRMARSISQ